MKSCEKLVVEICIEEHDVNRRNQRGQCLIVGDIVRCTNFHRTSQEFIFIFRNPFTMGAPEESSVTFTCTGSGKGRKGKLNDEVITQGEKDRIG